MNAVAAAMVVVLGLAAPLHTPDLQVEAVTASGAGLPELAEAVSRALVVGGARVVLRGPTSGSCEYCAKVKVTETAPGVCEVEVSHEQHTASTKLHLPAGSQLFDRARAIAIQARVLMAWPTAPKSEPKEGAPRLAHKGEARGTTQGARQAPSMTTSSKAESVPYLVARRAPEPTLESGAIVHALAPAPVESPPTTAEIPPLVTYTSRSDGKPASRPADAKPTTRAEAKPVTAGAIAAARPESKSATPAAERDDARRASVADLSAARTVAEPSKARWPWIPAAMGGGAAVAAGICAAISRSHYSALADKSQSLDSARSQKAAGEGWQTASLVLAGVAVAGVGTGIIGLATRSDNASVTALAAPISGGGMVMLAGNLP